MHAVESASDSAAVWTKRPRAILPVRRSAGARVENVRSLHRQTGAAQRTILQPVTLRRMVVAQTARPAGGFRRRVAGENAAAAGHQQKRPDNSTRATLPPCGRAQNLCRWRRDQIPVFRRRSGWKIAPCSKVHCGWRRLCFQRGGGDGKRAARGQLHLFGDFKAGKNRFAHAQCFAGRKLRDLGNVAVRAETAQDAIPVRPSAQTPPAPSARRKFFSSPAMRT